MPKASSEAWLAVSGDADFPGGNGVEFERSVPGVLRFKMVKHGSPACLWWCFRAQVPAGRRVTFELVNTADTLGRPATWKHCVPVFSYDRRTWRRLRASDCEFDEPSQTFRFSGVFRSPVVYLAQAYPYHFAELDELRKALRRSRLFRERTPWKSEGGRGYPIWEFGRPPARGTKPLGVFLCARNHAGETHGSWALDAMLREIAFGRGEVSRWLRANVHFLIAPFVDVDGVAEGMYGKDRIPVDFNRDWRAEPARPEVRNLQAEIERWSRRVRYAAHLDFHCPTLSNPHHCHATAHAIATPRLAEAEEHFAKVLARHSPRDCRFRVQDLVRPTYMGAAGPVNCASYQRNVYGVVSLTPEIAYHPTCTKHLVEPRGMARLGAAHARAIGEVLRRFEAQVRARRRPFYDPFEAPPIAPATHMPDSAFRWWGCAGKPEGQPTKRFGAREALELRGNTKRLTFVASPLLPLSGRARPGFEYRAAGVPRPRRGEPVRGLCVYVGFYDRRLRRFGGLYGSATYEVPLEGQAACADWRPFRPKLAIPKGAAYWQVFVRCELRRGRVWIAV